MLNEWFRDVCLNKDGKGDGSGTIPDEALTVTYDFYLGLAPRVTTLEQQADFIRQFQSRCGSL